MQASKIKVGAEYAIHHEGKLRAVRVDAIKTIRTAQDVYNSIQGSLPGDTGEIGIDAIRVEYKVEDVLGPFAEYSELVNARRAKEAAQEASKQADLDDADELIRLLYHSTGVAIPNHVEKWDALYSQSYSGRIEISTKGVKLMLNLLKRKAA